MKRIVSFDVGIKNMAYCIFDLSGELFNIHDWNVLKQSLRCVVMP